MKEIVIKNTRWEKVYLKLTKKEFEDGADDFILKPVIECEIPKGYNPMQRGNNDVIMTFPEMGAARHATQVSYHVSKNIVCFECSMTNKKEVSVKAYIV